MSAIGKWCLQQNPRGNIDSGWGVDEFSSSHTQFELRSDIKAGQTGRGGRTDRSARRLGGAWGQECWGSQVRRVPEGFSYVLRYVFFPRETSTSLICSVSISPKIKIFFFLAPLHDMWGLSSPIRDQTQAPCSGSTESQPLDSQGISLKSNSWCC